MAKTLPRNLGGWIAFRSKIGTAAQAAALAVSLGCSWVAPRAGDGSINDAAFLAPAGKRGDLEAVKAAIRAEIAAYHEAGLLVFPWLYSRPGSWRSEVEAFALLMECGADGVIIDAEIQWGAHAAEAAAYMTALRAKLGDVFIADAPWPWILAHPEYPERAFADGTDARLVQAYAAEINRAGLRACIAEQEREWAKRYADPARAPGEVDPIWPVACTYGRDELLAAGAPPCPGETTADELGWFLDTYPDRPVSLYSLEMLLEPTPNARACVAMLKARAEAAAPATMREVARASSEMGPMGLAEIERSSER